MKTDLFQFCGHCWVFQICWHIESSALPASSFRIWNSSTGIPSPPLCSPGSWYAQGSVCALQESVSPVLCKFWWLCDGVNGDLFQEGLCYTQVCLPRAPTPVAGHFWPYLCRRHSNTVLAQSLWGLWILVNTRFVWALWASLEGKEFDSKCDFASLCPLLLGLLLFPWMWGIFFWWDPTFSSRRLFSSKL